MVESGRMGRDAGGGRGGGGGGGIQNRETGVFPYDALCKLSG